jgi:DNA-binding NtrC family response regulator
VRLILPPLRKRKEDIMLLIKHFLENGRYNRTREGGRKVAGFSRDALERIMAYDWPGNIRELHNVVERAVSFADSDTVEVRDLPDHISGRTGYSPLPAVDTRIDKSGGPPQPDVSLIDSTFKDAKEQWISSFEKDYIQQLLDKNDNNISHAAREADIDRKYFRKLMKKYGIGAYESNS